MKLRDVSHKEWEDFCKEAELSSVYLDPRWLELIEGVYPGLKIHRLVCRDDHDDILWMLPLIEIKPIGKRRPILISLPFGNYGGIIFPGNIIGAREDHDFEPLVRFFKRSQASALELREIEKPRNGFYVHENFKRFEIVLPQKVDVLWEKGITGNARTSVRKADKFNLEIILDHSNLKHKRAVNIFQKIYEKNASFHGTPPHSVEWYKTLTTLFSRETEIVLAKYGHKFIGALLLLHYQGRSVLHGLVTDPKSRKIPVTDKLLWAAFEHIIQNKLSKTFDFGRTRPDPGKLFFKRKWGGVEQPIYYSYLIKKGHKIPDILPENPVYKPAIRVWRHLPMALKRSIGPFFRQRIPT